MRIETRQVDRRRYQLWVNGFYKGTYRKAVLDLIIKKYTGGSEWTL